MMLTGKHNPSYREDFMHFNEANVARSIKGYHNLTIKSFMTILRTTRDYTSGNIPPESVINKLKRS